MRATSVEGWMSNASDSLQSVVSVGCRIPRSIWLTNVRSTLALRASASCDIPRELRCSRSTCPNSVGIWSDAMDAIVLVLVAVGPRDILHSRAPVHSTERSVSQGPCFPRRAPQGSRHLSESRRYPVAAHHGE